MSERARIAFYLDFGAGMGLGHLIRSSALATALELHRAQTCLVTASDISALHVAIGAFDEVVAVGDGAWDERLPAGLDWLVVDHYGPDPRCLERLRPLCRSELRIVDSPSQDTGRASLIVDQSLGAVPAEERAPRTRLVTRFLVGPDYALLRPAFAMRRPAAARNDRSKPISRVLIAPGATDACGLVPELLRLLSEREIDVVLALSSLAGTIADVRAAVAASSGRFALLEDADDAAMASAIAGADVVIGNAGGGSFERLALGAPTVLSLMADNQRPNSQSLIKAGVAVDGGDARLPGAAEGIIAALDALAADPAKRAAMSRAAFAVCDGLGAFRVVLAMLPERARDGRAVELRRASAEDGERILEWQSDPETRRYSRDPTPPTREGHRDWMAKSLADHKRILSLIEAGGEPCGGLRLDASDPEGPHVTYEVSINVAPGFDGQSIGRAALRAAGRLVPFAVLTASVREDNEKSLGLFKSAGYIETGREPVDPRFVTFALSPLRAPEKGTHHDA